MEPTATTGAATPAATPNNTSEAPVHQSKPTGTEVGNAKEAKDTTEAVSDKKQPATDKKEEPKRTRILKVDGKEYEIDDERLEKLAQKGFGAEKKLWEASEARKKLDAERAQLAEEKQKWEEMKKMSPKERLRSMKEELKDPNLSKEFRAAMEDVLWEEIKADEQTPEQKELAQLRKEKEERLKQEETDKKTAEERKQQEALNAWKEKSEKSIIGVLEHSKMPKTPWNVKHIADIMYNHRKLQQSLPENERFDLSPEEISKKLVQDHTDNTRAITQDISKQIIEAHKAKDANKVLDLGDRLMEIFGEEGMDALRRYDLIKHTTMRPKLPEPVTETPKETIKKEDGKYPLSWEQMKEERQKRAQALQGDWKRA